MELAMIVLPIVFAFLFALAPLTHAAADAQVFSTLAGPVKITPLYHASTLIEAGGKIIYVDPAKPAKLTGLSQSRPHSDYPHSPRPHGSRFDQGSQQS